MTEVAVAGRPGAPSEKLQQATIDEATPAPRDAFPHTRRPLPWVLAGFMAMVFFVPITATELKLHLPVDSRIDRFAVIGLVLVWIWLGGDQRAFLGTRRSKLYVSAAVVFLGVAIASLLFDAPRIINLADFRLAEKRFALLGSFLILGWFALTALRFEDLRGFISYLIGLALLMSLGMLIERQTGYNIFYNWANALLKPFATVEPSPTVIHPVLGADDSRVTVVGPTNQGLAATTMLVMIMPFALLRGFDASTRRTRWFYAGAFGLMAIGALATDRKTALVVPFVVLLYIAFYRPRAVLKVLPIGLVLLAGAVHFADPGAIGTVFDVNQAVSSNSTSHRVGDFTDVAPDVLSHLLIGRGFGTLNPDQPSQFRIDDDEFIDELWQVGVLGLIAFLAMILTPVFIAARAIRTRGPTIASLALTTSAGCVAFLAACPLFDALSFAEVPYVFFLVAAMTTIAAAGPEGNVLSARETVRARFLRPLPRTDVVPQVTPG